MKKTIVTFVLGGLLTAGAFGFMYEVPITSAAEKVAPGMTREVAPKATGETSTQCIETTTLDGKLKSVDPKVVEACN